MQTIKDMAKKTMSQNKKIVPTAIIPTIKEGKTKLEVAFMQFSNDKEKVIIRERLKKLIKQINPIKYYVVFDSWYTKVDDEKMYRRPKRDIDRKSVIIITEFRIDKKNKMTIIPYKEVNNEIVFEKEINNFKGIDSYWNIWQTETEVKQKMDKTIKEQNQAFIKQTAKKLANKYKTRFDLAKKDEDKVTLFKELINEGIKVFKEQDKTMFEDTEKDDY